MVYRKNKRLSAHEAIALRKNKLLALARDKGLHVFEMETFKPRKVIRIANIASICTDEKEDMLYCITTSSELFSFEISTWECKARFFIDGSGIDKKFDIEDDELEFLDIYCYGNSRLLAVTLGCLELVVIDTTTGNARTVWKVESAIDKYGLDNEHADRISFDPSKKVIYVDYIGHYDNNCQERIIPIKQDGINLQVKIVQRYIDSGWDSYPAACGVTLSWYRIYHERWLKRCQTVDIFIVHIMYRILFTILYAQRNIVAWLLRKM